MKILFKDLFLKAKENFSLSHFYWQYKNIIAQKNRNIYVNNANALP